MEAFPVMSTIRHFTTNLPELYPESQTHDFHNKANGHARGIALYLTENFRRPEGLEVKIFDLARCLLPQIFCSFVQSHICLTQLLQSEAVPFAYRGWRRQWGDERRRGGTFVQQLNDCWAGTSWAIVNYFLCKKLAFYAVLRAMRPLAVGVQREYGDLTICHARPCQVILLWYLGI